MRFATRRGEKGFSLTELVVVLAVIALIAAIAIPGFITVRSNAAQAVATRSAEALARNAFALAIQDPATGSSVSAEDFDRALDQAMDEMPPGSNLGEMEPGDEPGTVRWRYEHPNTYDAIIIFDPDTQEWQVVPDGPSGRSPPSSETPSGPVSANPDWGGDEGGVPRDVATDADGNVYVAGLFSGTVTIAGEQLTAIGAEDLYVASYTASGVPRWVVAGSATGPIGFGSLAVSAAGEVYVVGGFEGTLTLAGQSYVSAGDSDLFIVSFSSLGVFRWGQSGGGASFDEASGVATDAVGNVYVVGSFSGAATIAGQEVTSVGVTDMFVVSYTAAGVFRWIETAGGTGEVQQDLAIEVSSSGEVLVSRTSSGTSGDSDGSSGGSTSTSSSLRLTSFSSTGTSNWTTSTTTSSSSDGSTPPGEITSSSAIAVDTSGNVYVAGAFTGTVSFAGTAVTSAGGEDLFLASYTPAGALRWVRTGGGTSADRATDVSIGPSGEILVTGTTTPPSSIAGTQLSGPASPATFLAAWSPQGAGLWAQLLEGDGDASLTVSSDGSLYLTGGSGGGSSTVQLTLTEGQTVWSPSPDPNFVAMQATGGDDVYNISVGGIPYRVHVFRTVGQSQFVVSESGSLGGYVEYLVVGGGGGGGGSASNTWGDGGGGGGAGGFRTGGLTVGAGTHTVVVGGGGAGGPAITNGVSGQPSSALGIEAAGGGFGARRANSTTNVNGGDGGSGGGGTRGGVGGLGNIPNTSPRQGNAGGSCCASGGGGASKRGGFDGIVTTGGTGRASSISGTVRYYAGGGGAGARIAGVNGGEVGGVGGNGGGGSGGDIATVGNPGVDGLGGGGGGGGVGTRAGARGGSGVVIVRYPTGPALSEGVLSVGAVVSEQVVEGQRYRVHVFEFGGTFFTAQDLDVEYLLVAGGGGGGMANVSNNYGGGGGGGAGGVLSGTLRVAAGGHTIAAGSGGYGGRSSGSGGTSGDDSTGFNLVAIGGGGGSGSTTAGGSGGSGGGGAGLNNARSLGGAGTVGQGFAGGNGINQSSVYSSGGGGGGAGGPGGFATGFSSTEVEIPGGPGILSSITGTSVLYASGGSGVIGASSWAKGGTSGAEGTGDGGQGAEYRAGGDGGSGIVVIRYLVAD
jgi:prepilin-type N-terminal cleavage/methylation domain-containing protein